VVEELGGEEAGVGGVGELVGAQLDLGSLEDEHLDLVGGEGEGVVEPLEESHFHDAYFVVGVAEGIGDTGVGDRRRIVPELHGYQRAGEQEVEELVVLDPILAHEAVGIQDDGNEHVSWELVHFEQVEEDHEELIQGVFYLGEGMGGEVLTVVFLNPRYTQLKQDLAGERGVGVEFEGFHW